MSRYSFEVCRSCSHKKDFFPTEEEKQRFLGDVQAKADIQMGQCQRLCPKDRITVSLTEPNEKTAHLLMFQADTPEELAKKLRAIADKSKKV